jgi:tetratricopeptide (TPR) repeat protein
MPIPGCYSILRKVNPRPFSLGLGCERQRSSAARLFRAILLPIVIGTAAPVAAYAGPSEANLAMAQNYNDSAQYDRAIQVLDKVIKLDPTNASAYFNRGNSYRGSGKPDLAIRDYDRSIRLNPLNYLTYVSRGKAYNDRGE